jgi:hypothetical protein
LSKANSDLLITETPFEDLKIFYLYDANNVPSLLSSSLNPAKNNFSLDGVNYLATTVGYTEAQMMKKEKLFTRQFDTLKGFFGNNIIITNLPKKTQTALDMMHFVPREFQTNYQNSLTSNL